MQFVNYRNIRIHQMQIFLSAAEHCNFTHAAEEMNVTPSMVSKTVAFLEQELGLILFRKSHGKLYLTPAGKQLNLQWTAMLKLFEGSISDAHAIQEAKEIPVHLGVGMSDQREDIRKILEKLDGEISNGNIILEVGNLSTNIQRVSNGDLDIAFCSGHLLQKIKSMHLNCRRVSETPLAIFLPLSHPLAQREHLSFEDLKSESFITYSPESDPLYWALLNQMAKDAGFKIKVACYVRDEFSFLTNLERGRGILFAESNTLDSPEIKKFILEGTHCDLYMIWRPDNRNYNLEHLLEIISE